MIGVVYSVVTGDRGGPVADSDCGGLRDGTHREAPWVGHHAGCGSDFVWTLCARSAVRQLAAERTPRPSSGASPPAADPSDGRGKDGAGLRPRPTTGRMLAGGARDDAARVRWAAL